MIVPLVVADGYIINISDITKQRKPWRFREELGHHWVQELILENNQWLADGDLDLDPFSDLEGRSVY